MEYDAKTGDEVEDLRALLRAVKHRFPDVQARCVRLLASHAPHETAFGLLSRPRRCMLGLRNILYFAPLTIIHPCGVVRLSPRACRQGVSCGAILSDYQRLRVEAVCASLGLTCLAYLWQRNQARRKIAAQGLRPASSGLLPRKKKRGLEGGRRSSANPSGFGLLQQQLLQQLRSASALDLCLGA